MRPSGSTESPQRRCVARVPLAGLFVAVAAIGIAVVPSAAVSRGVDSDSQFVYLRDCAVCHGADAKGTQSGPTLQGVGSANVDYQLTTGRMPLSSPSAVPRRQAPAYDGATIESLVAYVATIASGGPSIPSVDVSAGDVAVGGALFRAQCAACHEWAGEGGVLEFGNAPPLRSSTPTQIAEAVRVGPGTMPVFGDAALTNAQLNDIVAAVRNLDHPDDAGGQPLWHLGPLAEGAVALLALTALVMTTRLMGTRT